MIHTKNPTRAIRYLLKIGFIILVPNSLASIVMILNKNRIFRHKKKGDEKNHLLFEKILGINPDRVKNWDKCNSWEKQNFL